MKKLLTSASVCLLALVTLSVYAAEEKQEAKKEGPVCPVSGKPCLKEHSVAYREAEVYFCCPNCPKAFEANTAKFATKANLQLVQTKQAKQTKCPLTGGACKKENLVAVKGVKVAFCCGNCLAKAKKAEGDDQLSGFQIRDLRDHHREKRVGRDIEGQSEKDIAAAHRHRTIQTTRRHVELKEQVAGRELHRVEFADVPGAEHQPTRLRVGANFLDQTIQLIDLDGLGRFGSGRRGSTPATPLRAIDRAEFAVFIGPFVPDRDTVVFQGFRIRVSCDEPEQLVNDAFHMELLGRKERESGSLPREVETQLPSEDAASTRSRSVAFVDAVVENVLKQIQIGSHLEVTPLQ